LHDTTITLNIEGWQDSFKAEEKKHTASAQVHIINEKFDMRNLAGNGGYGYTLREDYGSLLKIPRGLYARWTNLFDEYTAGYGEWGIDEIMDKLPAKDQCIIVGIDHGGEYRITDMIPMIQNMERGEEMIMLIFSENIKALR